MTFNTLIMIIFLTVFFSIYTCYDTKTENTNTEKIENTRISEDSNISNVDTIVDTRSIQIC